MRVSIFISTFLIVLFCFSLVFAEKYAGEFIALGGGARAMGMGGAFIAIADDATASYWNPAGLANFSSLIAYPNSWQAYFMRSERFGDLINYNYISLAFPLEKGRSGWGLSFIHMGIPDIREIPLEQWMIGNSDGDGIFEPRNGESIDFDYRDYPLKNVNDYALFFSYAQKMSFGSVGASIKLIRNDQLKGVTSLGIGVDIGWMKDDLWRDLLLGVKLQDATGTYISWSTGKDEFIYPALKLGIGYPFDIKSMNSRILIAADGDFRYENRQRAANFWIGNSSLDYHLGAEILIRDIVAIRGGIDMGRPTAGAGFVLEEFGPWGISMGADYALLRHDELPLSHRVSLLVSY
jgi:hypothetical protein